MIAKVSGSTSMAGRASLLTMSALPIARVGVDRHEGPPQAEPFAEAVVDRDRGHEGE